jgi:ketosteroid isomerase-like protein
MSRENVEKLRASLASWNGEMLRPETRPYDRINTANFSSGLFAPDAVYEDAVLPDHVGEAYRGLDGFIRSGETWMQPYQWLLVELQEIIDADEHVVSLHRARVKMRHTEIEFESPLAYVYTFQDDKVVHQRAFLEHAEALKAVGLEE